MRTVRRRSALQVFLSCASGDAHTAGYGQPAGSASGVVAWLCTPASSPVFPGPLRDAVPSDITFFGEG